MSAIMYVVPNLWDSDHARGYTVQGNISDDSQQGYFLKSTNSVFILQQVGVVYRHLKHVLLHEDL